MDYASGGIDGRIDHGVVLSAQFVFVLYDLNAEQLDYENGRCRAEPDYKLVLSVEFHLRRLPISCRPVPGH